MTTPHLSRCALARARSDHLFAAKCSEDFAKSNFGLSNYSKKIGNKISRNCSESFDALNFELVEYKDAKGEKRPMYLFAGVRSCFKTTSRT